VDASRITVTVGIGPREGGGFGLEVGLDLHAPGLSTDDARLLMLRAHERCPYSNATRGNVVVALSVDGVPVPQAVAG
jgi:organic hydroperoxide reductase OsmC/OhrA